MRKTLLLHQAKEKKWQIDKRYEEQAFPYSPPKSKFDYNALQNVPISPARYFNQWLLNFNQYFVPDADYIFVARPVYEPHHLRSLI